LKYGRREREKERKRKSVGKESLREGGGERESGTVRGREMDRERRSEKENKAGKGKYAQEREAH